MQFSLQASRAETASMKRAHMKQSTERVGKGEERGVQRDSRALFRNQGISMLIILAVMWMVLALLSPYFFTVSNLFEITLQTAVIAIIAAGETFVILSGGIDLSVGSVFACAAVVGGIVFTSTSNLFLACSTTVAFGALLGLTNGVLITKARVPPFIATLGMMGVARGLALIFSRGVPIYGLNEGYQFIGQGKLFNVIPVPTLIVVVVFVLGFALANYTRFGRFVYSIGSNVEAARLSGINITAVTIGIYTICGLLSGLASSSRPGAWQPSSPPVATATSCSPSGRWSSVEPASSAVRAASSPR